MSHRSSRRYVVVAKVHQRESNGESHHDGSPLWLGYFEERSFTFTGDQPISAIFDRVDTLGDVIEIKLLDDGSNYAAREPEKTPRFS